MADLIIQKEWDALLKTSGNEHDVKGGMAALHQLAVALQTPLRQGIMSGDIIGGIFERISFAAGVAPEFPLDWLAPGTEKEHVAYVIPLTGRIPERTIEGDYVTVPVYEIGSSIDWALKYARDARWDIISRALNVLRGGFVKKANNDGWHTILGAGVDRNILVFDSDASAGQFTKRLVSLMKTTMRRNGGGNSTSQNRGKLTDLWLSPEGMEDMRNWNVDQIDEVTRNEIFHAEDGKINRIFGVNLHDLDELGEGQEYQLYFTNELSGAFASADVELAVGMDMTRQDSFVMPVRQELQVFEDDNMHRSRRAGFYAFEEHGFAVLDNRGIILSSY